MTSIAPPTGWNTAPTGFMPAAQTTAAPYAVPVTIENTQGQDAFTVTPKDSFIVVGINPETGEFWAQERKNKNGEPGEVTTFMDGKLDPKNPQGIENLVQSYIKRGFSPEKIIINGKSATDSSETGNQTQSSEKKGVLASVKNFFTKRSKEVESTVNSPEWQAQQRILQQQMLQQQQIDLQNQNQQFMQESMRTVMPIAAGGYVPM